MISEAELIEIEQRADELFRCSTDDTGDPEFWEGFAVVLDVWRLVAAMRSKLRE